MTQSYIAVIADMIGSRSFPRPRRRLLQEKLGQLILALNRDYRSSIAARFVVTLGDEFQGLLHSAVIIPDLIWRLDEQWPSGLFRVSVGLGTLDTPLQKQALNMDGPAFHIARDAIVFAKKTKALGGVFRGFGDMDDVLNGMARALWFHRSRWTRSQWKIARLLRAGLSQTEVARKLRISKQVVSRQVAAAGYSEYLAADHAWRMILQKQVDPLLHPKNGFSRRR